MVGSLRAGSDIRGCLRRATTAPGPRSVPCLTGFEAVVTSVICSATLRCSTCRSPPPPRARTPGRARSGHAGHGYDRGRPSDCCAAPARRWRSRCSVRAVNHAAAAADTACQMRWLIGSRSGTSMPAMAAPISRWLVRRATLPPLQERDGVRASGGSRQLRTFRLIDVLMRAVDRCRRGACLEVVMSGSGSVYRWCGCRDVATGRRLGASCPKLADPRRGSRYLAVDLPGPADRCPRHRIRRRLPHPHSRHTTAISLSERFIRVGRADLNPHTRRDSSQASDRRPGVPHPVFAIKPAIRTAAPDYRVPVLRYP